MSLYDRIGKLTCYLNYSIVLLLLLSTLHTYVHFCIMHSHRETNREIRHEEGHKLSQESEPVVLPATNSFFVFSPRTLAKWFYGLHGSPLPHCSCHPLSASPRPLVILSLCQQATCILPPAGHGDVCLPAIAMQNKWEVLGTHNRRKKVLLTCTASHKVDCGSDKGCPP